MIRVCILVVILSGCTPTIKKNCSITPYPIAIFLNGRVDVTGLQVNLKCDIWE